MRDYDVNEPVEIREERVEMRMEGAPRGYDREPELGQKLMMKEYKPNKQEILREYELRIKFLSVGCVVSVGCKDIPFRSVKEAMVCVNDYVNNPYEESKKWRELFESEEE
jgi:hypothetical protein